MSRLVPATLMFMAFVLASAAPLRGAAPPASLKEAYHEDAARLVGESLASSSAYDNLAWLCDRIGHRLSGSKELERAVEWGVARMKEDGLENVHMEPVTVPRWVRGAERAWIVAPARHDLSILGLGMSVGTPRGGVDAQVVVVGSFAELDSIGEAGVKGKIVLYDAPFVSYGKTVDFRSKGASRAAAYGAVAALVRSVGPISYDTPHTGQLKYEEGIPRIPAAAVTIENATLMRRMQSRGETIRVHLEMGAKLLDPVISHNVVGEIRGSLEPQEIVLISGHLDSWDVGQGAQDDGVGCILAMETAALIRRLDMKPRRTIRVVLYTNEENGVAGGKAYRDRHKAELPDHVAAIESDSGNGPASGFDLDVKPVAIDGDSTRTFGESLDLRERGLDVLSKVAPLLAPIKASRFAAGGSGADVAPLVELGVAGLGLRHDTSHYFDVHHTEADTFDKIDKADLNRNLAILSVMTWVLADMPERILEAEGMTSGSR